MQRCNLKLLGPNTKCVTGHPPNTVCAIVSTYIAEWPIDPLRFQGLGLAAISAPHVAMPRLLVYCF